MDRLHELFCLLDRLERIVAPSAKCTCTGQKKKSDWCILHKKNSSESVSSFKEPVTYLCQCDRKTANEKIIVYHNSAAQTTEVCND